MTKKEVEKNGCVHTESYTDRNGITFLCQIFTIGMSVHLRVYDRKNLLMFHNEMSFDKWGDASAVFKNTMRRAKNEDDKLHYRFASQCGVNYLEVKKMVEEWIVDNKRPMNLGDAQILASRFENMNLAMDHVYTAACYYENYSLESDFCKRNNFRVSFSL